MLKGIDPLLNGELLRILDEMGHADQLLLVDRNYPAAAVGRSHHPTRRNGDSKRVPSRLLRRCPARTGWKSMTIPAS